MKNNGNLRSWLGFRTFPHSNSKRKIEDRCNEDEVEAKEYTDSFIANRHRKEEIPSIYNDDYPDCVQKKYIPKANKTTWDQRKTIQKSSEDEFDEGTIQ